MAVRLDILHPVPEEPWWWPLGPASVFVGALAVVSWTSSTWPVEDSVLAVVRGWIFTALGAVVLAWVGLGVYLRQRRRAQLAAALPVRVDGDVLQVGETTLSIAAQTRLEWSPYGLVAEDADGRRTHVPARVSDAQAAELQQACDARRAG